VDRGQDIDDPYAQAMMMLVLECNQRRARLSNWQLATGNWQLATDNWQLTTDN